MFLHWFHPVSIFVMSYLNNFANLNRLARLNVGTLICAFFLCSCGGGGGGGTDGVGSTSSSAVAPTVVGASVPGANRITVVADSGPAGASYQINRLFTTVTVCQPGTANCTSIDHVLVDTGSVGLRIFRSASTDAMPNQTTAGGFPLMNCVKFLDTSYAWGPVKLASVKLGAMQASNIPIQVIADPAYPAAAPCAGGGVAITSAIGGAANSFGANGILGLGLFQEDCGATCAVNGGGVYFGCTTAACTATTANPTSTSTQIKNPVVKFASDFNGLMIDLPSVPGALAASVTGSIYFGVGTQSNNDASSFTPLTVSPFTGYVTTRLPGRLAMAQSFLDTGSTALFFDDPTLSTCAAPNTWAYCPSSPKEYTNVIISGRNGKTKSVNFTVASSTFVNGTYVYQNQAGSSGSSNSFGWGLPFFFGRKVFIGIEGFNFTVGGQVLGGPLYAL